jgi:hypothetical protein
MRLVPPFLLGLSWLANAASIPAVNTNVTGTASRDVIGLRSVAYFVNWVSASSHADHMHQCHLDFGDEQIKEATLTPMLGHLRT